MADEQRIIEGVLGPTTRETKGSIHLMAVVGTRKYSVWNPAEFPNFDAAIGKQIRIKVRDEYSEKAQKTYENYVPGSFEVLGDAVTSSIGGTPIAEVTSKEEWREKDRLNHRRDIALALIAANRNPDWTEDDWFKWVYLGETLTHEYYQQKTETPTPVDLTPAADSDWDNLHSAGEIDTSPITGPNEFLSRLKKYFPGVAVTTAAQEGGLKDATELGKQGNDVLDRIWQGIVAVRKDAPK